MTSSSRGKATSSSPQRFYDYLNGLQDEFERQSNDSSAPRHFNTYLGGLKVEYELMAGEIESLRKDRDDLERKGMYFVFLSRKHFTQP
jgi:hypothetical protein